MADNITDDVLDAILRESDGFWPPARERIQALIREHDAALIEKLADEVRDLQIKDTEGFYDSQTYLWIREKARQRREERA